MDSEQTHALLRMSHSSRPCAGVGAIQSICGAGTGGARARAGNASSPMGGREGIGDGLSWLRICPASKKGKKGLADLVEEANSVVCNLINQAR